MRTDLIASTPPPPYYAVIFTSAVSRPDPAYEVMAERMVAMAAGQPGFLGIESTRDTAGFGITVSYWESEAAIRDWKAHTEHQVAQERGKREWYSEYKICVAKVERDYGKV